MGNAPDFSFESHYSGRIVCGVDEAGRGPWAGPVVAAAVVLNPSTLPTGINDSKKLKAAARETLCKEIIRTSHASGVGIASVEEIDSLNILGATKLAMLRAVEQLSPRPHIALVDGNQPPKLPCEVQCVVKGDSLSLSIAAASILAKVTRDKLMEALALEFPQYGFERHSGYGTPYHQEALRLHGITPHHRRSYAPIRALLEASHAA